MKELTCEIIKTINAVNGFDPDDLKMTITDNNGEVRDYLPIKAQKLWFRLKYPDGVIRYTLEKVDYDKKSAVVHALVYANRKDEREDFLGEGYACREYDERRPEINYLEWAQTAAAGRALNDAGFGSQYETSGEIPSVTLSLTTAPSNNGLPEPEIPYVNHSSNFPEEDTSQKPPVAPQESAKSKDSDKAKGSQKASKSEKAQTTADACSMTIEKAMTVIAKNGANRSKPLTVGDLANKRPADLEYLAKKFPEESNPTLKAAAILVYEHAMEMAKKAS
jgi:hypothetical protein